MNLKDEQEISCLLKENLFRSYLLSHKKRKAKDSAGSPEVFHVWAGFCHQVI